MYEFEFGDQLLFGEIITSAAVAASVYTGTTPAVHGIVGNEWFNKATGKEMYCTDDETVSTFGDDSKKEGKMSPRNLQSSTITDEL